MMRRSSTNTFSTSHNVLMSNVQKEKFSSRAQERRRIATRNWLAVHAHRRKGGPMKDRKKEADKKVCRKKIRL